MRQRAPKIGSTRRGFPKRTRVAHHEAGHAVLSAAIGDAPHFMSIREEGGSLGRAQYRFDRSPQTRVQIHLAGFAAEELLKGSPSRQLLGSQTALSISALTQPSLSFLGEGLETCDQYLAVQDIIAMGCATTAEAIRGEVDRFYTVAKESLATVWPVVCAVAKALLRHTDLDFRGFHAAVGAFDIYSPVFAVQEAHGLLRR